MAGYIQLIKSGYLDIINAIIRPPRCIYSLSELGPETFQFRDKTFTRSDFNLLNERGMRIACSFWEPVAEDRSSEKLPCIIYLHGNSSARVESLMQLSLVLSLGATFLSFDFAGSGLSDGSHVSLGKFEVGDLKCVINYLRQVGTTSTIALWGRSMGAVTALLYMAELEDAEKVIIGTSTKEVEVDTSRTDKSGEDKLLDLNIDKEGTISGMILDSPFSDLAILAEEIIENGRKNGLYAPGFMVKMATTSIQKEILKVAGFDIKDIRPISSAHRLKTPAMFVAAAGDDFISTSHSQVLSDQYGGDRKFIVISGDHNSIRSSILYAEAFQFLAITLNIPDEWISLSSLCVYDAPPWSNLARSRLLMRSEKKEKKEIGGIFGECGCSERTSTTSSGKVEVDESGFIDLGDGASSDDDDDDDVDSSEVKIMSLIDNMKMKSSSSSSSSSGKVLSENCSSTISGGNNTGTQSHTTVGTASKPLLDDSNIKIAATNIMSINSTSFKNCSSSAASLHGSTSADGRYGGLWRKPPTPHEMDAQEVLCKRCKFWNPINTYICRACHSYLST